MLCRCGQKGDWGINIAVAGYWEILSILRKRRDEDNDYAIISFPLLAWISGTNPRLAEKANRWDQPSGSTSEELSRFSRLIDMLSLVPSLPPRPCEQFSQELIIQLDRWTSKWTLASGQKEQFAHEPSADKPCGLQRIAAGSMAALRFCALGETIYFVSERTWTQQLKEIIHLQLPTSIILFKNLYLDWNLQQEGEVPSPSQSALWAEGYSILPNLS